jgi:magnesium chelatase subunit I
MDTSCPVLDEINRGGVAVGDSVSFVTAPSISTLAELRASGHEQKTLRQEIRDNLLAKLRDGVDPWPGLHGFEETVIPQVERAVLAGHDLVLLGERGQGKTRLLRSPWSACSTSGRR